MKKVIFFVLVLLAFASVCSFSTTWAVGAAWSPDFFADYGLANNFRVVFQIPQLPIMFGAGFWFDQNYWSVTGTADWWAYKQHLVGILNLYAGPGLFVTGSNNAIALGGRVPIGLNMYPVDFFELFVELAPTLAVHFNPTTPVLGIQGALGFRFWF